jgi:hypothetical protein
VSARFAPIALLAGAALGGAALAGGAFAGSVAPASAQGAPSAPPCTPRVGSLDGRRSIAYCGPATVAIRIGARTYRFRNGLCDDSLSAGALELSVGTLVQGAAGNAGRSFVSLIIARSPSASEAFEADASGRRLFGDSELATAGGRLSRGTFAPLLGPAFSGSWDCHGVIYSGP